MSGNYTDGMEHEVLTCPSCLNQKTRPLDDRVAVCFDCDIEWYIDADSDRNNSESSGVE